MEKEKEKVYFREDLFVQNDNDNRKFNKKSIVTCSAEISLMNQSIPEGRFKFDSYEEKGGCYIRQGRGLHSHVNECDLVEVMECQLGLMDMTLDMLITAPTSQISEKVREEVKEFMSKKRTPQAKFDFIVGISKIPVVKVNEKMVVGDVSTFIIVACEFDKHYLRPTTKKEKKGGNKK